MQIKLIYSLVLVNVRVILYYTTVAFIVDKEVDAATIRPQYIHSVNVSVLYTKYFRNSICTGV